MIVNRVNKVNNYNCQQNLKLFKKDENQIIEEENNKKVIIEDNLGLFSDSEQKNDKIIEDSEPEFDFSNHYFVKKMKGKDENNENSFEKDIQT